MRGGWVVVSVLGVGLLGGGCLAPPPPPCADGTQCADDQVCAPAGGCVDPAQLAACDGAPAGAACALPGIGAGRCREGACVVAVCGDAVVDEGELCDDGNTLGGDGCNGTCSSNEACGNGIQELAEACDCGDADHPGASVCAGTINGEARCRLDCLLPGCGNGEVEAGEACDDGNTASGDGCTGNCASSEACGNGTLDVGEQCDDGNEVDADGCQGDCQLARCGDLILDPGEACDDGNAISGDGCTGNCASTEACGNGALDVGEQCDDGGEVDGDGCQGDCQLPRCGDEIVDATLGEACDEGAANSLEPDAACRPTCQHPRCGDGVLDPLAGEVCDDANVEPGDGCTFDCSSDETCGNGVVDFLAGETCEATDGLSHDGCSSGCRAEANAWTQLATPQPFTGPTVATYDAHRARVVLVRLPTGGGPGATVVVHEWDGGSWTTLAPAVAPTQAGVLAYDVARRVTVLLTSGGQTWTWNGAAWAQHVVAAPPQGVLAYHDGLAHVVLLSTWELRRWSGTAWVLIGPSPGFGIGTPTNLAYDRRRGELVTVYNDGTFGDVSVQVWDGTAWHLRAPLTTPNEAGMPLVYDPVRERVLYYDDLTWSWDGVDWKRLEASPEPASRHGHGLVYDAAHQRVLMLGGVRSDTGFRLVDEVWQLRLTSADIDDACATALDLDDDGLAGCADPDCWGYCAPTCPPPAAAANQCEVDAPGSSYCGDGTCSVLETAAMCPADCP